MKKMIGLALIIGVLGLVVTSCSTNSTTTEAGNLNVLVVDANNMPLSGAKVVSNTQPQGQLKVTGISEDDGTGNFNNIRSGEYEFYVSRFDYIQQEFNVSVEPKRVTEITITMVHE